MTSKYKDYAKKGSANPFMANTKGPKNIWVTKKNIIAVADVLDSRK